MRMSSWLLLGLYIAVSCCIPNPVVEFQVVLENRTNTDVYAVLFEGFQFSSEDLFTVHTLMGEDPWNVSLDYNSEGKYWILLASDTDGTGIFNNQSVVFPRFEFSGWNDVPVDAGKIVFTSDQTYTFADSGRFELWISESDIPVTMGMDAPVILVFSADPDVLNPVNKESQYVFTSPVQMEHFILPVPEDVLRYYAFFHDVNNNGFFDGGEVYTVCNPDDITAYSFIVQAGRSVCEYGLDWVVIP